VVLDGIRPELQGGIVAHKRVLPLLSMSETVQPVVHGRASPSLGK
jgi:hypothetical protein